MKINGIILPNPDWGDKKVISSDVDIYHARDGITRRAYIKTSRAGLILEFTIDYIKIDSMNNLMYSLQNNGHQIITLVDWLDVTYRGIILTNPIEVVTTGRTNCESEYCRIYFEFEVIE